MAFIQGVLIPYKWIVKGRERESGCMTSGQLRELQLCESIVTVQGIHQQQEELNG
jgi:hypothetical protein